MEEQINKVLKEKVDPVLAAHYGGAVLTGYDDGVAMVKLTGSCASCPSAQSTIEEAVSYTHLDVYKRQDSFLCGFNICHFKLPHFLKIQLKIRNLKYI